MMKKNFNTTEIINEVTEFEEDEKRKIDTKKVKKICKITINVCMIIAIVVLSLMHYVDRAAFEAFREYAEDVIYDYEDVLEEYVDNDDIVWTELDNEIYEDTMDIIEDYPLFPLYMEMID